MFGNSIVDKLVQKGYDMIKQMNDVYADFPKKMNVLKEFNEWEKPLAEEKFDEKKQEDSVDSQNGMNDE